MSTKGCVQVLVESGLLFAVRFMTGPDTSPILIRRVLINIEYIRAVEGPLLSSQVAESFAFVLHRLYITQITINLTDKFMLLLSGKCY